MERGLLNEAQKSPNTIPISLQLRSLASEHVSGPKVFIDTQLERIGTPFQIRVNRELMQDFLETSRAIDKDIEGQRVYIVGDHSGPISGLTQTLGVYTHSINSGGSRSGVILVNAQRHWSYFENSCQFASKIAYGEVKPRKDDFKHVLYTKRLSGYLALSPDKERALNFARELLLRATNRQINETFYHEVGHSRQKDKRWMFSVRATDMMVEALNLGIFESGTIVSAIFASHPLESYVGSGIVCSVLAFASRKIDPRMIKHFQYQFDPREIDARGFAKKYKNDPRWRNIIEISPKKSEVEIGWKDVAKVAIWILQKVGQFGDFFATIKPTDKKTANYPIVGLHP